MDLYILNKSLDTIGIIDTYDSLIWNIKYFECGDFELYLPATPENIQLLQPDNYVVRDSTAMIIQNIEITTDAESGNYLLVSGESLESILKRRIIWTQTTINSTIENAIRLIIYDNAVSPIISSRTIPGLILGAEKGYTDAIKTQLTGNNLYETVVNLCLAYGLGWNISLENKKFIFNLYKGEDKSQFIIFSPEFDNLINSKYQYSISSYANIALVAGEGEGNQRKRQAIGEASGLDRYEIYVDARDISTNSEEPITDDEYNELLTQRGIEKLSECDIVTAFEGDIETRNTFENWSIGDIVQVTNEFGINAKTRITGCIESDDTTGHRIIPTFSEWEVI